MTLKSVLIKLPYAAVIAAALYSAQVSASIISLNTAASPFYANAYNQGHWESDGRHIPGFDNYATGPTGNGDMRSFFSFATTGFDGKVAAATLRIYRVFQTGSIDLTLWDVATDAKSLNTGSDNVSVYADLGSGKSYGSVHLPANTPYVEYQTFSLNEQGLSDLAAASGFFSIGVALSGDGYIFGTSHSAIQGTNAIAYLDVEVSKADIPEPVSTLLMGVGLAGIVVLQARRKSPLK